MSEERQDDLEQSREKRVRGPLEVQEPNPVAPDESGVQAGDLIYAASRLRQELGGLAPATAEQKSLKITADWLEEQAGRFGDPAAITAIPPVR